MMVSHPSCMLCKIINQNSLRYTDILFYNRMDESGVQHDQDSDELLWREGEDS